LLAGIEIENIVLVAGATSATGNSLNNAILGNDGGVASDAPPSLSDG